MKRFILNTIDIISVPAVYFLFTNGNDFLQNIYTFLIVMYWIACVLALAAHARKVQEWEKIVMPENLKYIDETRVRIVWFTAFITSGILFALGHWFIGFTLLVSAIIDTGIMREYLKSK